MKALPKDINLKDKSLVVLSDSRSLVTHLQGILPKRRKVTDTIYDILCELHHLKQRHPSSIEIVWIPGHQDVGLNTRADELASAALESSSVTQCLVPGPALKGTFRKQKRRIFRDYLRHNIRPSAEPTNPSRRPLIRRGRRVPKHEQAEDVTFIDRRVQMGIFRLRIGHSLLEAHGARFGIYKEPTCQRCKEDDATANHVLLECSSLNKNHTLELRKQLQHQLDTANRTLKEFVWSPRPIDYRLLTSVVKDLITEGVQI